MFGSTRGRLRRQSGVWGAERVLNSDGPEPLSPEMRKAKPSDRQQYARPRRSGSAGLWPDIAPELGGPEERTEIERLRRIEQAGRCPEEGREELRVARLQLATERPGLARARVEGCDASRIRITDRGSEFSASLRSPVQRVSRSRRTEKTARQPCAGSGFIAGRAHLLCDLEPFEGVAERHRHPCGDRSCGPGKTSVNEHSGPPVLLTLTQKRSAVDLLPP